MPAITYLKIDGIDVERFDPDGAPNGAAIIIAHGSDAMNPPWDKMIEDYANELSEKGFICLIPFYLGSLAGGIGVLALIERSRPAWEQAISNTIDHAKTLVSVDSTRIGLLGFSLGGHLCLRLRAKAKVLVEYFGPELPELGGLGSSESLTLHAQIHHGDDDKVVPFVPNAVNIERELRANGAALDRFGPGYIIRGCWAWLPDGGRYGHGRHGCGQREGRRRIKNENDSLLQNESLIGSPGTAELSCRDLGKNSPSRYAFAPLPGGGFRCIRDALR